MIHHAQVDDTTWPVDYETELEDLAEWILRYGTTQRREDQRMSVASVLAAYRDLTDPRIPLKEAIARLRLARRASAHQEGNRG